MRYIHYPNNIFPHAAKLVTSDWIRWTNLSYYDLETGNPVRGWEMVKEWLIENIGPYRHTAGRDAVYFIRKSQRPQHAATFTIHFRHHGDYMMFHLRWS